MISEEEFNKKYSGKTVYFFLLNNTRTNLYSVGFLSNNAPSRYVNTKFNVVRFIRGIRFTKYQSFVDTYFKYIKEYCKEHNDKEWEKSENAKRTETIKKE